jgi:uncharacterized DUF497 family protein
MHDCTYDWLVTFQWDPEKARSNLRRHRVDFADATAVFEDPRARTIDDPHPRERRFVTLGMDAFGRLLVVCWTSREDDFRIISARRATRTEVRQYDKDA